MTVTHAHERTTVSENGRARSAHSGVLRKDRPEQFSGYEQKETSHEDRVVSPATTE